MLVYAKNALALYVMFAVIPLQAVPDSSCLAHYEEEEAGKCMVFFSYHHFLKTPFMVVVPYVDTNMEVGPAENKFN